jgi:hypothetical protein
MSDNETARFLVDMLLVLTLVNVALTAFVLKMYTEIFKQAAQAARKEERKS